VSLTIYSYSTRKRVGGIKRNAALKIIRFHIRNDFLYENAIIRSNQKRVIGIINRITRPVVGTEGKRF